MLIDTYVKHYHAKIRDEFVQLINLNSYTSNSSQTRARYIHYSNVDISYLSVNDNMKDINIVLPKFFGFYIDLRNLRNGRLSKNNPDKVSGIACIDYSTFPIADFLKNAWNNAILIADDKFEFKVSYSNIKNHSSLFLRSVKSDTLTLMQNNVDSVMNMPNNSALFDKNELPEFKVPYHMIFAKRAFDDYSKHVSFSNSTERENAIIEFKNATQEIMYDVIKSKIWGRMYNNEVYGYITFRDIRTDIIDLM